MLQFSQKKWTPGRSKTLHGLFGFFLILVHNCFFLGVIFLGGGRAVGFVAGRGSVTIGGSAAGSGSATCSTTIGGSVAGDGSVTVLAGSVVARLNRFSLSRPLLPVNLCPTLPFPMQERQRC